MESFQVGDMSLFRESYSSDIDKSISVIFYVTLHCRQHDHIQYFFYLYLLQKMCNAFK